MVQRTRAPLPQGRRSSDRRAGASRPSRPVGPPWVQDPTRFRRGQRRTLALARSAAGAVVVGQGKLSSGPTGQGDSEGRFWHPPRRPGPPVRCRRRHAAIWLGPSESGPACGSRLGAGWLLWPCSSCTPRLRLPAAAQSMLRPQPRPVRDPSWSKSRLRPEDRKRPQIMIRT